MSVPAFDVALPPGYRADDALASHGRDTTALAEQVDSTRIRKGVVLDGVAAVIGIELDGANAHCTVEAADESALPRALAPAREAVTSMLGLRIDPAAFAQATEGDALLGPIVRRQPGLRVIQSATVFEALTWAIIGQQINLAFAISLRRTFIEQAGCRHDSGLWCYPDAAGVARLDIDQLTQRKFSRAKAETLLRLAQAVDDGRLDLSRGADPLETGERLLAIKGIGPWTVDYGLLRGWGHPDCSLQGDVAVRSAIARLLGLPAKPSLAEAEAFLLAYRPHRTMAAAYLWASLD